MSDSDAEAQEEREMRPCQVVHVKMPEEMQQSAFELVNDALDKFSIEKDIATHMKKQFDEKHQDGDKDATWHCVVGKSFGCSITHETKYVIFFKVEQMHVLIFKSLS